VTVLRNNLYVENLFPALPRVLETGVLVSASGTGAAAWVARDDCARAAAALLASKHPKRGTFDVTGPAALTHAQLAQVIARASGRPVEARSVPVAEVAAALAAAGLPAPVAAAVASIDLGIAAGHFAAVSHAVTDLSGRVAHPVADLLAARVAVLGRAGR
jgi:NAD(P)H dehydrogenase (quinone)